jgi:GNAT superfamily N-acetyltransferase
MSLRPTGKAEGSFVLRKAEQGDGPAIATVFSFSLRLLTFLPALYTADEERWFIENTILAESEVTVATSAGTIVAFLARQGDEIRLLYTHPDFIGRGAGSLLVELEKSQAADALELWCFQENWRARRFYERRGFRAVQFTDGSRNEERMADVRYRWERDGA